jgi:small subunit ribosomal protein S6
LNAYEMTFIVRPDLDEDQTRSAVDQVTGRIANAGGEVVATVPWNPPRRRMAYQIRDFGDGLYITTVFRIDSQALRPIESALRLNENVLRFLLVQATERNIQEAQQRLQQQTAAPRPAPVEPRPEQPATAAVSEVVAEPGAPEVVEEQTAPEAVEEKTAPEVVEEQTAPAAVEEQTAPEVVEEQTAPAAVEEQTAPAAVEEQTAPAAVAEQTAPEAVAEQTAPEAVAEQKSPEPVAVAAKAATSESKE